MKKLLGITSLLLAIVSVNAQSYYSLSFTGQSHDYSTSLGTVNVEVFGLSDNYTGPASQVLITSFPGDIGSLVSAPVDATSWSNQYENNFTVVNGVLTSVDFWANIGGNADEYQLFLDGRHVPSNNYLGFNFLNLDGKDNLYVYADNGNGPTGLVGVGSTPTSTPEPGTIALAGLGIAGLAAVRRKK